MGILRLFVESRLSWMSEARRRTYIYMHIPPGCLCYWRGEVSIGIASASLCRAFVDRVLM